MRTVNGIDLDDGVDEPGAYDWRTRHESYHKHVWDGEKWISEPNNRPQDGRVCDCEDAPCCGHYEL